MEPSYLVLSWANKNGVQMVSRHTGGQRTQTANLTTNAPSARTAPDVAVDARPPRSVASGRCVDGGEQACAVDAGRPGAAWSHGPCRWWSSLRHKQNASCTGSGRQAKQSRAHIDRPAIRRVQLGRRTGLSAAAAATGVSFFPARALFVAAALPPDGVRHIRGRHVAATHVNSLLLVAQVGELPALGSINMNGSPGRHIASFATLDLQGTVVLGLVLGEPNKTAFKWCHATLVASVHRRPTSRPTRPPHELPHT